MRVSLFLEEKITAQRGVNNLLKAAKLVSGRTGFQPRSEKCNIDMYKKYLME